MIGFPGSIGGEVYMNASAHGQCISDCITSVLCYSRKDGLMTIEKDRMGFDYRTSRCERDELTVLEAEFELTPTIEALSFIVIDILLVVLDLVI